MWVAAGIAFGQRDGLLGIALLAWTLGLRHGLDADHISAIDNATRQMVSLGQLPLTCGLFFSLGHSTIVIAVNVAIAVSVDIYDKLDKVGSVGGIVGTSVSASFLFLVAVINTYFLIGAVRYRKAQKARVKAGLPPEDGDPTAIQGGGCLVRIIAPIMRAVDKPWKLYPVGILFGFGFDTASSIALLAISAIAARGSNGEGIAHGKVVILPFLFTAGMSLVDSLDSVLMLYAYAQPDLRGADGKIHLFYRPVRLPADVESIAPLNSPLPLSPGAESSEAQPFLRPPLDRDDSNRAAHRDPGVAHARRQGEHHLVPLHQPHAALHPRRAEHLPHRDHGSHRRELHPVPRGRRGRGRRRARRQLVARVGEGKRRQRLRRRRHRRLLRRHPHRVPRYPLAVEAQGGQAPRRARGAGRAPR
ncbi:hypothetical protein VHUM_01126 [Vanrija humicola]|uniref:Nickel/cobalt efflux system n=1 Tax=Vanrija humicola TaxID=5417 RepID=A0A7D8V4D6_VANHU|nr:hypothetical protein VHUM_01126 [Vanrija humicola]